ncbi:MAG: DNA polymerase III subunit delta [Bacteroidetes bacterium]|nr:DNA polymerase III subunit delta [Bacteroidota bacterium]
MDFNQIMSDLKKKVYKPVYFLMGDEPYFIDIISDYIENNVLDESEKEFNQSVLYGKDVTAADVIGAAKRFPMMSEYQVVIVKEAQNIRDLVGKVDDDEKNAKGKEKAKHPFLAYIENPLPSTILVICYKYKSVDKRTSVGRQLDKYSVLFESKKLYDNQVPDWINNYLKGKEYTVGPKASAMLTEYLGTSLSKISNELDKLMINLPPKSEITPEHIQTNIGISKDYNVFELQTAIGRKETLKANRIINYFAANDKDNPMVVTMSSLYGYFCKILTYHFLADKKTAAAAMGVHPFFVKDYEIAARNYSPGKLKSIFGYLREYDLKSKGVDSGSATHGELLKELVFKILH